MTALRAEALVENTRDGSVRHEVEVTLSIVEWRMLVGDFAARVLHLVSTGRPIFAKLVAAGVRPCDVDQQEALGDLIAMLTGPTHIGSEHQLPPTFTLTPKDASTLIVELATALDEPVQCRCGRYVEQPTQLTDTCGICDTRAGLRVVGGAP